jgi:hypothetical protein
MNTYCCLCGEPLPGSAIGRNNPWPFYTRDDTAWCCDDCNVLRVIPARTASEIAEVPA